MLPCCAENPPPDARPPHDPVPVVTQYASPDLISAIAYDGHDPAHDPNWPASGAPTQDAYGRWCRHLCGMACLRMALLHRDGQAPSLFELLAEARLYGAYTEDEGGEIKGLIYAPFAQYVKDSHGIDVVVHRELTIDSLIQSLDAGHMVMASVSKEIRRPEHPPQRRGGHLVLVIGHQDGHVIFRNPSGHTEQARDSRLPVSVFEEFFGGRGVSLNVRPAASHTGRAVTPPTAAGGGRLIAVLGEMGELGDQAVNGHRDVGRMCAEHDIDLVIAVGDKLAKQLALAAADAGVPEVAIVADNATATNLLEKVLRPGDRVLTKASRSGELWQVAQALTGQQLTDHAGQPVEEGGSTGSRH